jgi:hypothetical protein
MRGYHGLRSTIRKPAVSQQLDQILREVGEVILHVDITYGVG